MATEPSTALATADPTRQSNSFLAKILEAATNPEMDAVKMETMANLAVKLQDRERETEFNRALNAAIMDMPVITKEGKILIPGKNGNPDRVQGRFARFEDIYRVVRPILERHNLAIRFDVGSLPPAGDSPAAVTVAPILSHANGHTERGEAMRLPPDVSGSKNATQAVGSSSQYGKRYTMCAMLNIVTEGVDDDGHGGQAQVVLPFEREQAVLTDATVAHEAGKYLEWYGDQSPKDRAWLLQSGNHVRFGGQSQLTPPSPPPPPPPPPAASTAPKPKAQTPREQRAREWADWFKDEVKLRTSAADVEALRVENESTLNSLQRSFPDLYAEADRAAEDRLASL